MILGLWIFRVIRQLSLKLLFRGSEIAAAQCEDTQTKVCRRDFWIEFQGSPELLCRLINLVLAGVGITPEDVHGCCIGLHPHKLLEHPLGFSGLMGASQRSSQREQ